MVAAILFISFAVLLLMGAPIAVCLGTSSVVAMIAQGAGRPLDTVMSSLPNDRIGVNQQIRYWQFLSSS